MLRSRPALACFITLLALLAPVLLFPGDDDRADRPLWERMLRRVRKDTVAADAADQMTAGYYEDLFDHSSRTISTNRLVTGKWATNWSRWRGLQMNSTNERVPGFVYYKLASNLDVPELGVRLRTNSFGMADREYTVERPPGTRRIGVIGDSVVQGLGATAGKSFEARLEEMLGADRPAADVERYELLNFAVGGYRVTQMLWVVDEIAPRFSPQAYLIVCSDLTVFRKWGDHVGQLVHDGIDLHYPFLEELAVRADLRPDDDPATLDAKLAPHRNETVRWAMETMRRRAREEGAEVVAVLVPTVGEPVEIAERFEGVPELFAQLDIPCVNLLDTFEGVADLEPYRLGRFNYHPSDLGHELLAQRLLERLKANPRAWSIVAGVPEPAS
ncbi:MAG: SGNH/GDSL hydrolase family protein [Candidatus Eiseniibacteriota bacterium]